MTNLEARRIVLKMLAVSSTHSKMQNELSNERALSLLADVCNDPSHENLTNGLITLANVAQNVASHELVRSMMYSLHYSRQCIDLYIILVALS